MKIYNEGDVGQVVRTKTGTVTIPSNESVEVKKDDLVELTPEQKRHYTSKKVYFSQEELDNAKAEHEGKVKAAKDASLAREEANSTLAEANKKLEDAKQVYSAAEKTKSDANELAEQAAKDKEDAEAILSEARETKESAEALMAEAQKSQDAADKIISDAAKATKPEPGAKPAAKPSSDSK